MPGDCDEYLERLAALAIPGECIAFRDAGQLAAHLDGIGALSSDRIGNSRSGQPVFGVRFGTGSGRVSIVAGSHSDEPIGPMVAQALPVLLAEAFPELLERLTFHVVPNINPDGADRNRTWFANPPGFRDYACGAFRETPGDDIEFGFGESEVTRPECRAAMSFLRAHGPYDAHFSLHGMPFAEGAWFLLCKEWSEGAPGLLNGLTTLCERLGVPLHDIDRHGEKGFTRIAPGFCTTPHSVPMREHFLGLRDPDTAAKFLPSSMEFIQSLGGDPICMVSEMPLFLIGARGPSLEDTGFTRFRDALTIFPAEHPDWDPTALDDLLARFAVTPFPIDMQIRLQVAMIVAALTAIPSKRMEDVSNER